MGVVRVSVGEVILTAEAIIQTEMTAWNKSAQLVSAPSVRSGKTKDNKTTG